MSFTANKGLRKILVSARLSRQVTKQPFIPAMIYIPALRLRFFFQKDIYKTANGNHIKEIDTAFPEEHTRIVLDKLFILKKKKKKTRR